MRTVCLAILVLVSFPLRGASLPPLAASWNGSDLAPLDDIIGDAHFVGLGESVHATEGFSQAKYRLIRHLVEHRGFRAIGMETPWTTARKVTRYVASCDGSSLDAVKSIFPVWWSQSVEDLFAWLCQFNREHPEDPVRFFGFDIQNHATEVLADLQLRLPHSSLAEIKTCIGFGQSESDYLAMVRKIYNREAEITDPDFRQCQSGLASLQAVLEGMPASEAREWARVDVNTLQSWESQLYYVYRDDKASKATRDKGMARNFEILEALQGGGRKAILWAHNAHLAFDYAAVQSGDSRGVVNMGSWLYRSHGNDYAPIALTGYEVRYHWPGQDVTTFPMPGTNSVESILHATPGNAVVDTGVFPAGKSFELGGDLLVPAQQFRGFVYLEQCDPMVAPK